MSTTTDNPTVKFAGDEHPERFVHNGPDPVGQLVLSAINAAHSQIEAILPTDDTAEVLAAIQQVHDQSIGVTDYLNAQIDPDKPYLPIYLSPEITAAAVKALVKCEAYLHIWAGEGEALERLQRALRATGRRLIQRGDDRGWLPLDIFFILDDDTGDYNLAQIGVEGAEKYIGGIEAIWFFDRYSHTHLCEITPSYCLHFLEVRAFVKPEYEDDEEAERVRDRVEDVLRGPGVYEEVSYRHVHDVDRFLAENEGKRGKVYHWGNPGLDLDGVRDAAVENLKRDVNATRRRSNLVELDGGGWENFLRKEWADQIDSLVDDLVLDKVREAAQSNSVL